MSTGPQDGEVIVVALDDEGRELPPEDDTAAGPDGVLDLTFGERERRRLAYDGNDRFAIYKLMAHFREDVVRQGRIFVAGAGALGNEVLKNFALLGVGSIWLCDFDDIDRSNLAKSVLFRPGDIGRRKVDVAAERLRDMDPDLDVRPFSADVRFGIGLGLFRRMDVLCSVVDSIDARVGFNRIAAALGKPWLDAGIGELSWRVACWFPTHGACYECTMDDAMRWMQHLPYAPTCAPLAEAIREMNRQPTSPLAAAMSGAMMAQEALKLLHASRLRHPPRELELPYGHQFYFGGGAPYLETQVRSRVPDCEGHEHWGDIHEAPDLRAESTTLRQLIERGATLLGCAPAQISVRLGFDLVTEIYCHPCGLRTPYFHPRRSRWIDLRCPRCGEEARPDYKRALRITERFVDRSLAELSFPKLQIFQLHGAGARVNIELTGDVEEVMGGPCGVPEVLDGA